MPPRWGLNGFLGVGVAIDRALLRSLGRGIPIPLKTGDLGCLATSCLATLWPDTAHAWAEIGDIRARVRVAVG